jgi:hypothetical protein
MKTETTNLPNFETSRKKVESLLALKKVAISDIEGLSLAERQHFAETCTQTVKQLKGAERDNFLEKIDEVMHASAKSSIWEYNHLVITEAISELMRGSGVMPSKTAIAEKTGLSRQTVNKHLKEYQAQPEFTAQMEGFKFMAPQLLANVFKYAGDGDMRAARLFFEMVGAINKQQSNTAVNRQTNYIQVNNTILSQENLKQLSPRQLNQIEKIITKNGGQKVARAAEMGGEPIKI